MGSTTRDWLVSLSCIVATVIISVIPLSGGEGSPLFGYILDAGHFFFYAFCASLIYRYFPLHPVTANKRFLTTALTGTVLSGALELLQPSYGRSASIGDFVASSSGAFFGALCFYPVSSLLVRTIHLAAMVCVGIFCLRPALLEWQSMKLQESMFPRLATFEDALELRWWSPTPLETNEDGSPIATLARHVSPIGADGEIPALAVRVNSIAWRGVVLRLPPNSWTGYKKLVLYLYSEADTPIRIRIDDAQDCLNPDDRFSDSIQLHPGWNEVEFDLERIIRGPKHRKLDLTQVRKLFLYSSPESKLSSFLIGKISLM